MGLYRSARPLVFLVPPEAAHRTFGLLLRLPLLWAELAGARDLPTIPTELAGLRLANPVGLAAGFDKDARGVGGLSAMGFGYLVVGTVTRAPRAGNPKPRLVRLAGRRSLVNAMGLPNQGALAVAARLRAIRRRTPLLVSIADEAADDVLANHRALEPWVDGFELNASCPNVRWGRDADDESHLRDLVTGLVSQRARPDAPLFVKLPPFVTASERDAVLALAAVAQEAGADGLTCSNTRPVPEPRISVGRGGLSGAALAERTPGIVADVRRATGGAMPVNACGGISGPAVARACLEAGATTVQLYTGLVYEGPRVVRSIVRGLSAGPPTGGVRHLVQSVGERPRRPSADR
jgi:dihydroorotate dehydrogenase